MDFIESDAPPRAARERRSRGCCSGAASDALGAAGAGVGAGVLGATGALGAGATGAGAGAGCVTGADG